MVRLKRTWFYFKRSFEIFFSEGFSGFGLAVKRKFRQKYLTIKWKWKSIQETPVSQGDFDPLLGGSLFIFTGVPFDDIGGGQRAAQLTRCALRTGRQVIYVYVYRKYDFEAGVPVESRVGVKGLTHLFIEDVSPELIFDNVSGDATALFEFPHPQVLPFLEAAQARGVHTIFELIDDWESSLGAGWFDIGVYREFLRTSGRVVGTAKALVSRLESNGRSDAEYLPNAANEYIFDQYRKYERPKDMPRSKAVALYFGSLYGDWFSWEILIFAAHENRDTAFVLIGDKPNGVRAPKNVYFLGSKRIEDLPSYLCHADIALLPFVPGKISDAVSPIKVFEYLFMGKPVVSTLLPEVVNYPNVFVAETKEQYAKLIKSVQSSGVDQIELDLFISRNSWFARLDKLLRPSEHLRSRVSAVILIHNNERIIERCLATLISNCSFYLKEIIVVDNLSSDKGPSIVKLKFPDVKLVSNDRNGCASGRNLGGELASGDLIAFFDSDQWFTSGQFMEEAMAVLAANPKIGAVGWVGGWFDRYRSDLAGMVVDDCPNRAMDQKALDVGVRTDIGYLGTGGMILPRSVFKSLEGFDAKYDPTCFEDTDLSFQIKAKGFSLAYRDLVGIRHQPHQTTKAHENGDVYKEIFARNAAYFKSKWAAHPEYFVDYED